jgi:hypothetical protein
MKAAVKLIHAVIRTGAVDRYLRKFLSMEIEFLTIYKDKLTW